MFLNVVVVKLLSFTLRAQNLNLTLGFTFTEVHSVKASTSKVTSCHFSSDGKFLASGGHDKKVSE